MDVQLSFIIRKETLPTDTSGRIILAKICVKYPEAINVLIEFYVSCTSQ